MFIDKFWSDIDISFELQTCMEKGLQVIYKYMYIDNQFWSRHPLSAY